jgi:phosphatidylserine/phosphatidylglycerophosphate/cardiolipin synthase-like enzyme
VTDVFEEPEILVTGMGWLGGNVRSLSVKLGDIIRAARSSLDITVYSLTDGADEVLAVIDERAAAGIRTRIIVDDLEPLVEDKKYWLRERLREMIRTNPATVEVWNFPHESKNDGIHAKVVVADRTHAIIGSANLSFRGLLAAHELGVLVHGSAARTAAECIDKLILTRRTKRWGL